MRTTVFCGVAVVLMLGMSRTVASAQAAHVTEAVNDVEHGKRSDAITAHADVGTAINDGEYLKTGVKSRAEMKMPSTSITRLGAETIFNYSADSNRVDLQEGTILFCKPKEARQLSIMTAAVTAGITGTTGFVSVSGEGNKRTYIFGIIEGHATATVTSSGRQIHVGAGEILEFRPGRNPFTFSYDLPRFVKSSPLLHRFKSTLTNQPAIDKAVADYDDDLSRGFILAPSNAIDYSGLVPVFSNPNYSSAQNAQGQNQGSTPPPPPPPNSLYPGRGGGSGPGTGSFPSTH